MKPAQVKAHQEREAKKKLRTWSRRIPDNAALINIMAQFEGPFRRDFYYRVKPYLRFSPLSLEVINGQ